MRPRGDTSSPDVGVTHIFSALTAVRPFHASVLGRELRALSPEEDSPLAKLRHLQLGRWVVIDQLKTDWPGAPRRPPRLNSAYLLFTATVTVPCDDSTYFFPSAFIEDLRTEMASATDSVWRHCWGYPGVASPAEFRRYFLASRLKTGISHFGYGDAPVKRVGHALETRREFMEFALRHQLSGKELQDAYIRQSKKWPS